ncbi:MAG TPA: hypothetical protein VKF32_02630 [Thermoanaerobaculia bacterium]|nr:hypothetical protein [Thermoanaerobaculia bacterium]
MAIWRKGAPALLAVILAVGVAGISSAQQLSPDKTIWNTAEPVDVGGTIVPPGTYLVTVINLSDSRDMIQVRSEQGMKVIATALSTPHERKVDAGSKLETHFVFFPANGNRPKALRTWFPSDTGYGHDVLYKRGRAEEIAVASKENVISYPEATKEEEDKSAPISVVTQERTAEVYTAPAPAPALIAENRATRLPKTASTTPLAALAGLAALGAAFAIRATRG